MIDHETEELLPFNTCEIEGDPSLATRYRWTLKGCRGGIKLESIVVGNKRFTSKEAIGRFIRALNAPRSTPPEITASQRARQDEAAKKSLKRAGV